MTSGRARPVAEERRPGAAAGRGLRIGIFAHVGRGNLGDEATVAALIQAVRERYPAAEPVVFSANPADTEVRHGVRAVAIRRDAAQRLRGIDALSTDTVVSPAAPHQRVGGLKALLKRVPALYRLLKTSAGLARALAGAPSGLLFAARSFQALRSVDHLIVAGGGQLGDYFGGPWGYPFSLFRWCALARLAGARVTFASVGAEPIRSPLSKRMLRWALAMASYRSFRDVGSRRLIESIGVGGVQLVCPDLVHGFDLPRTAGATAPAPGLTVAINPVPFFDARYWTEHDETIYQRYVDTLASFACWLAARGHRILFIPTQVRADPPVIRDIELSMKRAGTAVEPPLVSSPLVTDFVDLTNALSAADVVVASRFHGIIFSLSLGKPVLALSYYRKTEDLMSDVGLGPYVLAIRDLDLSALTMRFTSLATDLDAIRARIVDRRQAYRHALGLQYERILGLPELDGAPVEIHDGRLAP